MESTNVHKWNQMRRQGSFSSHIQTKKNNGKNLNLTGQICFARWDKKKEANNKVNNYQASTKRVLSH